MITIKKSGKGESLNAGVAGSIIMYEFSGWMNLIFFNRGS